MTKKKNSEENKSGKVKDGIKKKRKKESEFSSRNTQILKV